MAEGASGSGLEIEVKIRIERPAAAAALLEGIGARRVRERHLEENYLFDYPEHLISRRGCLLRLRRTPGRSVLTFKGEARVEGGAKVRSEKEVLVGDPGTFAGILEGIGLRITYRYEKYRTEFEIGGVRIAVDELPIGNFLELEGPQDGIRRVARAIGYGPERFLTDSYRGLHLAHIQRTGEPVGDLLFHGSDKKGK